MAFEIQEPARWFRQTPAIRARPLQAVVWEIQKYLDQLVAIGMP
jgi:hypothetical protein